MTHALQPLDVAVFKSLRDSFAKAVRVLSFTKKNFIVTKREFAEFFIIYYLLFIINIYICDAFKFGVPITFTVT